MFQLRDYQREAVDSVYSYWGDGGGNPLVVMPTGTGKCPTLCTIIKELVLEYQGMRIVNLTHVKELVGQNAKTLRRMWDWAPMGIYSAGLGQRDLSSQILFAGIQSIAKQVRRIGSIDLTIVDECDLISPNSNTLYRQFLSAARDINPDMRLLGLTATPYRLGTGYIHEGDDAMFDDIAFEYKMTRAFDEGWLKPLTTKDYDDVRAVNMDMSGVGKSGGDYIQSQMQDAADKDHLNRAIAESVVRRGTSENRKSWLVFATGEEHARHLAAHIEALGVTVGVITGNSTDRDRLIERFKSGEIRCLVNVNVLTVGFDHPGIDLIAFARPTKSLRLYVQMLGRGTRPVWPIGFDPNTATADDRKAAMKQSDAPNCLVLDYAKNINEFGPVDLAVPKRPGKRGGGDAPVKACPDCKTVVHASLMMCPDCGYEWERQLSSKITQQPAMQPVMSKAEPVWLNVMKRSFFRHEKFGSKPSVRVEYWCGGTTHKEWISIEHESDGARAFAAKLWRQIGGKSPEPKTVDEALERAGAGELTPVEAIRIEPSGKYFKITGRRLGGEAEDEVVRPPEIGVGGNLRGFSPAYVADRKAMGEWDDLDADVPF